MKTHPFHSFFRRSLAAVGVLLLAAVLGAQTPATGTIEGRVLDVRRGEYLEKARLTLDGSTQEAFTDAIGQYRFVNVPAGAATIRVFYTGVGSHRETVTVAPGQIAERDITVSNLTAPKGPSIADGTVKLDSFVVSSSKEMDGAAIAINEQRFARNIVNVVSADEFGTIADGSPGELLKFLPGMTISYTGGDARSISMNGVPPDNVPVSMGGFDLANSGNPTGRETQLTHVSSSSIARVEVSHSPTAESPGAALAGTVNFVPRSSFERNKPLYTYSFFFNMRDSERSFLRKSPGPAWEPTYKIHPSFDLSAIVPVNKNFGFTFSAGYSKQHVVQAFAQNTRRGGNAPTTGLTAGNAAQFPDTTFDSPYLTAFNLRDGGKWMERYNFVATVDYRFTRHDRLSFGMSYGHFNEHFSNHNINFAINRVEPGGWTRTSTTGATSTPTVNAGQLDITGGARYSPSHTLSPTLVWRHNGPLWKMETGLSHSNSSQVNQDVDKGAFSGVTARRTNVTVSFSDIFYLRPGRITVTDPAGNTVDPYKLENYSLVNATSLRNRNSDTRRQAYANVRRDLVVRDIPVSLKTGVDVRTTRKDVRGLGTENYNYVGADGVGSSTPVSAAGVTNDDSAARVIDESFSTRVPGYGFPPIQWIQSEEYLALFRSNPAYFTRSATGDYTQRVNNSKRAEETISSAYFRADVGLFSNRLKLVGGLRAEQTNIEAEGPLTDPTRNFQRDASGKVIFGPTGIPLPVTTDSLAALQRTLVDRGYHAKKEYLRLFPNLNASYNISENLIARAAYYQSVGRPNFNQFAGGISLPNTELPPSPGNRLVVSNASIKSWQAETFRVRLEYYFLKIGQISFGAFQRDIKDFFGTVQTLVTPEFLEAYGLDESTYGAYDVQTQFNLPGTVRMRGFEFDYKQALTFLPNWARGVQVFANVSSQRATGTDTFPNMTPFTANYGISLTRPKWNLRINENYRGLQRTTPIAGRSIEPGSYNYRPKQLLIDVSGEYYFKRSLGVFFAIRNLNNAFDDRKAYGPSTPKWGNFVQRQDYAALWTAGIKGSF
ncbi:MAG: carboxypeptidase regulatory-like domain-containing protein [Opitutaceae bacterium]|nr:carboxypeptidase regulatory-like domain-containing protein [Opitutaceae bacterium]